MPTPIDWQEQILREVGDPNGTLTPLLGALWGLYADQGAISPVLQMLYAKRAALDLRLAEEQPSVDIQVMGDVNDAQGQRFTHLQQMREQVQVEIARVEAQHRARRAGHSAALTRTAPTMPPSVNSPDANDDRFRGSPYRRRRGW